MVHQRSAPQCRLVDSVASPSAVDYRRAHTCCSDCNIPPIALALAVAAEAKTEGDTAHTRSRREELQVDLAAEGNLEDMLDLYWVRILVAVGCLNALVGLVAHRE
jgi:hypothetical protein